MKQRVIFLCLAILSSWFALDSVAADGELKVRSDGTNALVRVQGDNDDEWRFQASEDLLSWANAPALGTVFSDDEASSAVAVDPAAAPHRFVRAIRTTGLFDTNILRTIRLTFTNANWTTLLASGRTRGSNLLSGTLAMDNGITLSNVGARYKGNTSYDLGGAKKSVNLDINWIDPDARLMRYRAVNLNNAAGDETIMREPVYFNLMNEYAPSPHGALAKLVINDAYWGVYSMVDQINNDLIDEWFPSHNGDRWRAPNIGGGGGRPGGGGGFGGGGSAFTFLGTNIATYSRNYELRSDNSTNAWQRLVHAIDVLSNTPTNQLRDKVEDVFAVDRWLWFLAVENILVDDDSYWNKGADYAFYYEPESGRIHPVEHDGNEAFASAMGVDYRLSPVQGAASAQRPLLSKLLSIKELRQRYLAHMRTVLQERFNPAYLTPIMEQFRQLSVTDIVADPKKNFTMTGYTNDLLALKRYVTNRYNFLTNHAELTPLQPRILALHGPSTTPGPLEAPVITAQVEANGNDGIDSVWLYWRDKKYGRFSVAQMFDDGAHGDGAANDGTYGGATAMFPAGNRIHFYVEARAANSAQAAVFAPARAEEETYSYQVGLTVATNSPVLINELMALNQETLEDPQGDFDDWIELRNVTDAALDLTGIYLTDDPDDPRKWQFPDGTTIPANGYLLVWADEDSSETPGLHASFRLAADGEQILLIDTDAKANAVLDSVVFGPLSADRSYGRLPASPNTFGVMQPTPGTPNTAP